MKEKEEKDYLFVEKEQHFQDLTEAGVDLDEGKTRDTEI